MPKLSALTAVVLVIANVGAGGKQNRAADQIVPGRPTSIAVPPSATASLGASVAERLLRKTGVRFGLEVPPADPNKPSIDLATLSNGTIPLGGRRLGEALNEIVKAAPAIRWTELDGVVIVRSVEQGASLLDRPLAGFAVKDAGPRTILESLLQSIDPFRPDTGLRGNVRPASSPRTTVTPAAVPAGRNVTVTLRNTTVGDALSAAARLNGSMSWTLRYDAAPPSPETASWAFEEGSGAVAAASPWSTRAMRLALAGSNGRGPRPLMGPIPVASIGTMISVYAARTGAKASIEELPSTQSDPMFMMTLASLNTQDVEVAALTPSEAITRLLSYDSRYEWTELNGRIVVRPKAALPGRLTQLDQPLGKFLASKEPAGVVIDRLASRLGTLQQQMERLPVIAAAMQTPVTISLPDGATIRDGLDALSDATGWTWIFKATLNPGSPTTLFLEWRGPMWSAARVIR